jgi:O-acetyl-ADP-ribose deacetylase (regulator of RNase III)
MIAFRKKGDMFKVPADIRVNTVNCVGVMGKGVALEFKKRFPGIFQPYKLYCDGGYMHPGKLHIVGAGECTIVNFATKDHWNKPSNYIWIESGLEELRMFLENEAVDLVVTIPALGCGNGGLDWAKVKPLITRHLKDLSHIIYVFEPNS